MTAIPGMKARYGYIVLLLIDIGLTCLLIFIGLNELKSNDLKFCQIVHSITDIPAIKPVSPGKDPSREKAWENYHNFVVLGRSLGCPGMPSVKAVP
jgi:hypothetical protein